MFVCAVVYEDRVVWSGIFVFDVGEGFVYVVGFGLVDQNFLFVYVECGFMYVYGVVFLLFVWVSDY